ncbi:hypothetical protein POSPLADRAFT_1054760 [Postia placenta MAD-698-R-SB12]|uniref:Uncharacterized protein n=1 Tax=Postia placenta MAD-698-R-SB12 TaxID=670580 RepID=A0A1X6N6A8_9APHY|nr:hypothetical protein POSPLADRAFT_1054760 [Postia placenta MAD-698-R-SB12]OSX64147.1 hypothetical protein POSPLADRAFT_1054760 [Postia placenta MAD-698-R-SB12]
MVVTRRAPVPPAPTSRTHSTQPIPRVKGTAYSNVIEPPDGLATPGNGAAKGDVNFDSQPVTAQEAGTPLEKNTRFKKRAKQKSGTKKSSRGFTFRGLLSRIFLLCFRIFLLWFSYHTLTVCPQDEHLESHVCRGLSEYRRLVIGPYILPPIQYVLAHPSIAPYVERAKPYTERTVNIAKPIIQRTAREWHTRVVPQWKKRVVPLWRKHAVPQVRRLDAHIVPYRTHAIQEYERWVGPAVRQVSPYVEQTVYNLRQWQQKARPYVVLAAHKTYYGYQRAAPYARPVLEQIKLFLAQVVAILADRRRQFVDPHVRTIWERVKELSSGGPKTPAAVDVRDSITSLVFEATGEAASVASSLNSAQTPAPSTTLLASDIVETTALSVISDVISASESLLSPTGAVSPTSLSIHQAKESAAASGLSSSLEAAVSPIYSAASVPVSSLSYAASSFSEDAIPHASFVASSLAEIVSQPTAKTFSGGSSITSPTAGELLSSASTAITHASASVSASVAYASSVLAAGVSSAVDQVASAVTSATAPSVALSQMSENADIDLDEFYAELGLLDVLSETSSPSAELTSAPSVSVKAESEEEKAERQRIRDAQTADRRADIMARHDKWEAELAALIETNKKALRRALVASRKTAAAELKDSPEIRAEIEGLVEEAEKFLRGAEKYLQTLSSEGRTEQEKRAMWERVADKVEEKFTDRLGQTEAVVNGWYMPILDKELTEVRKVTQPVRDLADQAQTDIGMDYAYLDDVTYQDWQRYHDLLRRSDNFTNAAHAMQNGSDHAAPANPVLQEISDIQSEVQDVVIGFETRLRRVKRNGERVLGENSQQTEASMATDKTVSILPIEDKEKVQSPADINVPPVVIGRSKEEVVEALNRAADQDGQSISPPDATRAPSDPDNVARSLAEEVVVQSHADSLNREEL